MIPLENFRMELLGSYDLSPVVGVNSQSPFMEPANWQTFESEADNLVRVVENNNNLFADSVMRIRVLDNAMSVVSESTVTHQGGFPSNPTFVYAADFVTGKYFTYNGNSGFYTQMSAGGAWEGSYAPTLEAVSAWQSAPEPFRLSGDQFARGGAWFVRLPKGSGTNWNRLVKWVGASTEARTLPVASVLSVDNSDPSDFAFYVNIDGTAVYTIATDETWLMKEYDGDLAFVQGHDMSFAKESTSEPVAFAVMGDFFFVQQPNRKMQVWQISTQTKVGEYQFSADDPGVSSPAKILPHPSGLVFVQRTPTTTQLTRKPSEVYSFRFADPATISCNLANIDETVYDLARRAGIPSSRINLAGIATDSDFGTYWGMGVGRPATARSIVEILQRFAFFDLADIGGKLIGSRRDRLPDGTIGGDDLRGHTYGETPPTLAKRERDEDYELPRAVRVNYTQALAEYEPGTEGYSRRVTDADTVVDIDLTAIAMDPDEAAAIAEIATVEQIVMREGTDVTLVATEANKALKPGDIKTLDVRGREDVVRIMEMGYAYPGLLNLKLKRHDPAIYSSDAVGGGRGLLGSVLYSPGPTTFALLDAPLVREHDDTYGYFAALGGNPSFPGLIQGWPGGDLERLEPAGWEDIARVLRPGNVFETCLTALPDDTANYVTANTLQLSLNGILESATLAELCRGANLAAVKAGTGWELIRFTTAAVADGVWTISGIVRGVHGTEWATALHNIGDQFILLGGEQQIITAIGERNQSRSHNAATLGYESDPLDAVSFAWTGVDRIPYSPSHLGAERDVGDDLILTWTRRDRVGQELQSGQTLPLSETTEAYEVDIYDAPGTTVLRTITSATPTATYTAAQQTADFGSLPTELDWDVRQMGELGRGYARRITSEGL